MSHVNIAVSFNTDNDGALRRECRKCHRAFKAKLASVEQQESFWCPYCQATGSADEWFTGDQLEYLQAEVAKVAEDKVAKMFDDAFSSFRSPNVRVTSRHVPTPRPTAPPEPDDMTTVPASCHPEVPVKVMDDWRSAVHCHVCGGQVRGAVNGNEG